MSVQTQTHGRFKAFTGKLQADRSLGSLADEVSAWARAAKAAPKSIGVEYLEASQRLVLTVGYRDDEPGYPVKLTSVSLGRISRLEGDELAGLESKMEAAAARLSDVICHELFITEDDEFLMVFMTRDA
ncbi:MAG TPA: hypothetical protein VFS43_26935 [Polyangiaceae bacterium]|nr:hypothetical protein [Polyangiaceae bacterium]